MFVQPLLEILVPIQQSGDVNWHRHCFHSPLTAFRIKSRRPIVTESLWCIGRKWEMKPKRPSRIHNIGKPNREQSSLIRFPSLLPLEHLRTTGSLAYWIFSWEKWWSHWQSCCCQAVSWQWFSPAFSTYGPKTHPLQIARGGSVPRKYHGRGDEFQHKSCKHDPDPTWSNHIWIQPHHQSHPCCRPAKYVQNPETLLHGKLKTPQNFFCLALPFTLGETAWLVKDFFGVTPCKVVPQFVSSLGWFITSKISIYRICIIYINVCVCI